MCIEEEERKKMLDGSNVQFGWGPTQQITLVLIPPRTKIPSAGNDKQTP